MDSLALGERHGQAGLGDLVVLVVGEQAENHSVGLQPTAAIVLVVPPDHGLLGGIQVAGGVVPSPLEDEKDRQEHRGQAGRRVVGPVPPSRAARA
jgi:hypothetical protein